MIFLDFETRSQVDLKKVGAYKYANHPSTEIICMAYAGVKGKPIIWTPYDKKIPQFTTPIHAWNAQFDYYIYKYIAHEKLGFPSQPIENWRDMMAWAAYQSLPMALDKCAKELGLEGKHPGRSLIQKLCKPKQGKFLEYTEESAGYFHEFYRYCQQDVRLLQQLYGLIPELPALEHQVWLQSVYMNERGLPMDQHELTSICEHVTAAQKKLDSRTKFITDGKVNSVNQVGKLKEYIQSKGHEISSVDREAITKLLSRDVSDDVRALVKTRLAVGLTSVKKFFRALDMWWHGYVHDSIQYYGAHTGRFSGRGFQLQNLNRKSLKNPEESLMLLCSFAPDEIEIFFSPYEILDICSRLVRSVIRAPEGFKLICADFSSIEAIAAPWVTGEHDMLEAFVKGHDLYKTAASKIFHISYDAVDKEMRQAGKLLSLACQYAGGYRALIGMAKNYGVRMETTRAKDLVAQFRFARPQLTGTWKAFEQAAIKAINSPGNFFKTETAVPFILERVNNQLHLYLPSGRKLVYRNAHLAKNEWLSFQIACTTHGRTRFLSGANLFQNAIQALCRDLLVEAQLRLEEAGYPIILTVHDECCALVPDLPRYNLDEFIRIMTEIPAWAKGLPVRADGWEGYRYKK